MTAATTENLHLVWCRAGVVAARCLRCGHGKLLDDRVLPIQRGNMTNVSDLKLKCSACGSTFVETSIPATNAAAVAFLEASEQS